MKGNSNLVRDFSNFSASTFDNNFSFTSLKNTNQVTSSKSSSNLTTSQIQNSRLKTCENQAFLRKLHNIKKSENSGKSASELLGVLKIPIVASTYSGTTPPVPKPRESLPKPKPRTVFNKSKNRSKTVDSSKQSLNYYPMTKVPLTNTPITHIPITHIPITQTPMSHIPTTISAPISPKPKSTPKFIHKSPKNGGLSALLTKDFNIRKETTVQDIKASIDSIPTCTTSFDFTQNGASQCKASVSSVASSELISEAKLWFDNAILKVEKDNRITKWLDQVDNEVFD